VSQREEDRRNADNQQAGGSALPEHLPFGPVRRKLSELGPVRRIASEMDARSKITMGGKEQIESNSRRSTRQRRVSE
jgi:hypothetical protein